MTENVESFDRPKEGSESAATDKPSTGERIRDAKEEIGRRVETVTKDVRREATRAGEYAKERYGVAKENLRTGYDRARKDFDQLLDDVNSYVRDNPGRSVLIAAGAGFLLGLLLRGGDRRSR